jgi:glycosyltransferase involved in cell wall biosynthesis
MEQPKRAFLYTVDFFPQKDGAGSALRTYSNARAYLELGYETELVHLQTGSGFRDYEADLAGLRVVTIDAREEKRSSFLHAAYLVGFPYRAACGFFYKGHATLQRAVRDREARCPGAIHHFEMLPAAHVATCVKKLNSVWSCHDIPSDFVEYEIGIDTEVEGRAARAWELRKVAFLRRVERTAARKCSLVLCISRADAETARARWGSENAELLPISMPYEAPPARLRLGGATFEVLHLGQIHHVPTFRSLAFLFEQVLPRLSPETANRTRLNIVGPIIGGSRCARLQEMGARFPQVKFFGRVSDLQSVYGWNDLQIVAATEATGLRTRIVESFASGVPVLSSSVAAQGIEGLRDGENIVLADDAAKFVAELERFGREVGRLESLAKNGQKLYEEKYSRKLVAGQLEQLLERYFGQKVATAGPRHCDHADLEVAADRTANRPTTSVADI